MSKCAWIFSGLGLVAVVSVVLLWPWKPHVRLRWRSFIAYVMVATALFFVARARHPEATKLTAMRAIGTFEKVTADDLGLEVAPDRVALHSIAKGAEVKDADMISLNGPIPVAPQLTSYTTRFALPTGVKPGDAIILHSAPKPDANDVPVRGPVGGLLVSIDEAKDNASRGVTVLVASSDSQTVAEMLGLGEVLVVQSATQR